VRLTLRFTVVFVVLFVLTSFALPLYFRGPYPHPPGPTFDKAVSKLYLHEIDNQHPAMVLLGDSLLTKDVDAPQIQNALGLSTYKLDIPGSSSALWYLITKSNIVPAGSPPRYLIVLFRDTILTAPTFRTTGPYFGMIDKFAAPTDTLLTQRAYLADLNLLQPAMEEYLPLYTYRSQMRDSLDAALRHTVPALTGCDHDCADGAMQDALGDIAPQAYAASIVQAEQVLYANEELNFSAQVNRSFLPEIIQLAQSRGIQLIFVRAPTNIFPNEASKPKGLETYIIDLKDYLAAKQIPMIDLSHVKGIGPAQFVDPHHMTLEGKAIFTQALAEALKGYVK
ncbi:MAG TPA: hypothetical protein VMT73_05955, partial [Anaerolineales bacterium]|nr:hypothetical protein [Anaerolineales bacterium]